MILDKHSMNYIYYLKSVSGFIMYLENTQSPTMEIRQRKKASEFLDFHLRPSNQRLVMQWRLETLLIRWKKIGKVFDFFSWQLHMWSVYNNFTADDFKINNKNNNPKRFILFSV